MVMILNAGRIVGDLRGGKEDMTEKRYIYASVGVAFEILDSWFGYIGDDEPTEREIEEYDYLVIGLAPDQDAAEGICRRLNDQQDEINHLSNFGLHVILDKKNKEIEQLKQQINDMLRFEHTGEHIRLSINIETGKLQRHIYATGQWFGDFDRALCENWISKEDYQRFIDRVIEVYNTEFKGDVE